MVIKPSISFLTSDTDSKLITRTRSILDMLDANAAIYTKPAPELSVIQTSNEKFAAALAAAMDGSTAMTTAKNTARAELVDLLRLLASYVQVACNGSLKNLQLSGFPIQKPTRTPATILPAPTNLTVDFGARSGMLNTKTNPNPDAVIYNWRAMIDGQTTPVQTAQTTAARNSFDSLTPGVIYQFQCNVVNSVGPSEWSKPISQMAV